MRDKGRFPGVFARLPRSLSCCCWYGRHAELCFGLEHPTESGVPMFGNKSVQHRST